MNTILTFDECGIPVIPIPTFLVGTRHINEYELRHLMVMAADGDIETPIQVMDIANNSAVIKSDGSLSQNLEGLAWTVRSTMQLLSIRNKRPITI